MVHTKYINECNVLSSKEFDLTLRQGLYQNNIVVSVMLFIYIAPHIQGRLWQHNLGFDGDTTRSFVDCWGHEKRTTSLRIPNERRFQKQSVIGGSHKQVINKSSWKSLRDENWELESRSVERFYEHVTYDY